MKYFFLCLLLLPRFGVSQPISIVPKPEKIVLPPVKGTFTINDRIIIVVDGIGHENSYFFLRDYLQQHFGLTTVVFMDTPALKQAIHLNLQKTGDRQAGAYKLDITKDGIYIEGDNDLGIFYGVQTLIQLLPVAKGAAVTVPYVSISDRPRFAYRGLHLDVGRHFMPVSFIKRYIDLMALHKLNYFHWHLTEDQGWRIEIRKYPRLTSVGSMRNGTIIGRYPGKGSDNKPHGGFYTQDQVREILAYAEARYITVVPEIELPGHGSAAIAAYPYLSCFPDEKTKIPANMISKATADAQERGEKKFVQETWGVFDDVFCAGSDSTFNFLQDVLDEVIELFPSKYIHIGGDECPKSNWKRCPKCQQRIKQNGLKNEHQLQSYFIKRIEEYVNKKGRTIIGWDEILEGGLAPKAVVMSWRGEQGGIAAAKEKHQVIMTPGNFVYFDHSQSKNEDSVTIGSYTPIEEVYNYEPATKALTPGQAKYVIGSQANVWTEYMSNPAKVEYMVFPRLAALSEVLWTQKGLKNLPDFEKRLKTQFKRYDLWKVNYSKAYYELRGTILAPKTGHGILYKLDSKDTTKISVSTIDPRGHIKTIQLPDPTNDPDGSKGLLKDSIVEWPVVTQSYTNPIPITRSGPVKAYKIDKTSGGSRPDANGKHADLEQFFSLNMATGRKILLATPPAQNFPGEGGAFGLVNGAVSERGQNSTEWLGWQGKDMEATIDLGKPLKIHRAAAHVLVARGSQPCKPKEMEILASTDGITFISLGKTSDISVAELNTGWLRINVSSTATRFVKFKIKNFGIIPDGMPGAGNEAWLYVDEIQID